MRFGFANPFLAALGGGDRYLFAILEQAAQIHDAEIELYAPRQPDVAGWSAIGIHVDPGRVAWHDLGDREITRRSSELDLLVSLTLDVPPLSHAGHSVAVVQFPLVDRGTRRGRARAQVGRVTGLGRALSALNSYDRFLCYSSFAQGWIGRRLNIAATVLAPPIDVPPDPPSPDRDRSILSVARFVVGGHDKRQDALIDAFRALVRTGAAPGWTLHLAGTMHDDDASRGLVEDLRARAEGLPVRFHVNASRRDLLRLYDHSSLLWHAAGADVDPWHHPEQLEHFGIVVAEGMARGTVPIVVAEGGPAGIVRDGLDGRHWRTQEQLVAATRSLIGDHAQMERFRAEGYEAARRYDTEHFEAAVAREVIDPAVAMVHRR